MPFLIYNYRITPTPVGNTIRAGTNDRRNRDHPHTCGEYTTDAGKDWWNQGSPPHLWGIPNQNETDYAAGGITPTSVGNTEFGCLNRQKSQDHPHTCGEYSKPFDRTHVIPGSPPHLWGILMQESLTATKKRDHPHTCGEYSKWSTLKSAKSGSPPHLWGILVDWVSCGLTLGITPTPVGNTQFEFIPIRSFEDHPHTCGEYSGQMSFLTVMSGSPPHLWGILGRWRRACVQ